MQGFLDYKGLNNSSTYVYHLWMITKENKILSNTVELVRPLFCHQFTDEKTANTGHWALGHLFLGPTHHQLADAAHAVLHVVDHL